MIKDHEYSVLGGHNRSRVGQYIGALSAIMSTAVVAVFLWIAHLLQSRGYGQLPQLVLWPISATTIYLLIYWAFDRFLWKYRNLNMVLKVPDLAGVWQCEGQTLRADKSVERVWTSEITITQTWDKIRVYSRSTQSNSNSIAASLFYDQVEGFRILYNYRNEPNVNEPELETHRGFADLVFAPDLKSARGEYFNGQGRFTFGVMKLTRAETHSG